MDLTHLASAWIYAIFVVGLAMLFGGGHFLVDGSSRLARLLRINPIIVGLTIVALGTSMPEFLVSLTAAIQGKADFALGNVIGSNFANIGLILGVSALVRPIDVNQKLFKFEIPLVIVVSLFFWLLCANKVLGRIDGFILLAGFIGYLYIVISGAKKDAATAYPQEPQTETAPKPNKKLYIALIVCGIIGLTLGANLTIDSASEISRRLGVSELVLGLTVVALGTSLPELATSLVAAIKQESDISIGNIIGSNIFNMMAIAGPSAIASPLAVADELLWHQFPVMVALTIILFPLLKTQNQLGRLEGAGLLICYLGIMFWWTI